MRPSPTAHEGREGKPSPLGLCEDSHSWAPLRPRDSKPLGPGPQNLHCSTLPGIPLCSGAWELLTSGSVSQEPAGEARPAQG